VLVAVCVAAAANRAAAQTPMFTGMLTGHIGAARGGDVREATTTGGLSMAVIETTGLGAEIDIARAGNFDRDFFVDSSVASFMLNFIAVYPDDVVRPFVVAGVGALRLRAAVVPGQTAAGSTEAAWNGGAGVTFQINDLFGVRGDVRYFRLFDRPTDLVLRDAGFFDYWRTSIGATFSWPIR
jgi:hypothetical protein